MAYLGGFILIAHFHTFEQRDRYIAGLCTSCDVLPATAQPSVMVSDIPTDAALDQLMREARRADGYDLRIVPPTGPMINPYAIAADAI